MAAQLPARREMTPEVRRAITRWIVQASLGVPGYGLILFLPAGRLDWVWGWAMLIVVVAFMAAHPLILIPINPELLAERQKGIGDTGVKAWDKWIARIAAGMMPVSWVVAGLDFRNGWSAPMALATHLGGLVATVLGFGLFLWAMASNAFFAEGVRIQEERGHVAATGGPYRFVRHPGYLGAIVAQFAMPFLLGSLWVMIPGAVMMALYVARTGLEDRTLLAELPGYADFARKTRYRLIPGLW